MQGAGNKPGHPRIVVFLNAMFLTALASATPPITHPPDDSDALLLLDHKALHDRWNASMLETNRRAMSS